MSANKKDTQISRLSCQDALSLYRDTTIHDIGSMAFDACRTLHPEPYRTYVVDRNINYSNCARPSASSATSRPTPRA